MSAEIYNWTDGYLALRARAYETRGSIELDSGARWPRTTGEDAILIAAFFHDAIRRHGTPGILRRWHATLAELEREALGAKHATYRDNRELWSILETAAVFLDDVVAEPPPPALWDALIDQLGARAARNLVGVSATDLDEVRSFDDLYLVGYRHLRDERGADELDAPTGFVGVRKLIPRTTNADVIALAGFWDHLLKRAPDVMGRAGVDAHWRTALEDIAAFAMAAPATATYAKNNEFWRTLANVAIYVAAASEAPTSWDQLSDILLSRIGTRIGTRIGGRNAGPSGDGPFGHFDGIHTYDDLYLAQYKHLRDQRGADDLPAPTGMTGATKPIPRATNADILALTAYWSKQLESAKRVMGRDAIDAKWKAALADVEKTARPGKADDVYAKNNEFWRVLAELAVYVASADESPTAWDLVKDSLADSLHHLPQTIGHVAEAGADLVAGAAQAAGKAAGAAGKGLFGGLGTPLLIGGGLLGLFLITRHHGKD